MRKRKKGLLVHNVYEIVPPDGTIIGMATEEEMEIAAELELQYQEFIPRLLEVNIQLDGSSYKELLQEFQEYGERKSRAFGE